MVEALYTARLRLRDWSVTDAPAALKIYGHDDVSRWLHDLDRISDEATMQSVLQRWDAERSDMTPGTGRWAVTLRDSADPNRYKAGPVGSRTSLDTGEVRIVH